MKKRTSRGFGVFTRFKDARGAAVSVHESSEAGVRRVWVETKGGSTVSRRQKELYAECAAVGFQMPGDEIVTDDTSAYLTPEQARRVARALLRWADQ